MTSEQAYQWRNTDEILVLRLLLLAMLYGARCTRPCTKLAQRRVPVLQKQATETCFAMVLNVMLRLIGEWQPVPGSAVSLYYGPGRGEMDGPNEALLSKAVTRPACVFFLI